MPDLTPQQKALEKIYRAPGGKRPPTGAVKKLNAALSKPSVGKIGKAAGSKPIRSAAVKSSVRQLKTAGAKNIVKFGGGLKGQYGRAAAAARNFAAKAGIKSKSFATIAKKAGGKTLAKYAAKLGLAKFFAGAGSVKGLLLLTANEVVWSHNIKQIGKLYDVRAPQPTLIRPVGVTVISEGEPPFIGGQESGTLYLLKIYYKVRSKFNPDEPLQSREIIVTPGYYGAISGLNLSVGGDGDTLVWEVTDGNDVTHNGAVKPSGTSAVLSNLSGEFIIPNGATDTGGNPPVDQVFSNTGTAIRRSTPTVTPASFPNYSPVSPVSPGSTKKIADNSKISEDKKVGIFDRPSYSPSSNPVSNPSSISASNPTQIPTKTTDDTATKSDRKPKGATGLKLPVIVPGKATRVNNPGGTASSNAPTTTKKALTPKVSQCKKGCGGSGGGSSSTGDNNLQIANTVNDLLLQNPLLKKIDATTTTTQSFMKQAWEFTKADKILNGLGAIASIHNAAMLSQDVGQTLGDAATSGLNILGITDAEGAAIDVNSAISGAVKNKINSLFPEATTTLITSIWLGLNRIHQAVGSTVSAIQGTKNALLEADEITGGHIAKIGNALQDQGIIEEESYDFMNPEPNYKTPFKGVLGKIEDIQNISERVSQVVSTGLEIKETSTELITTSDELNQATQDFLTTFNDQRTTDVADSQSPAIDRLDLLKKEPED